jgi:hypothetical protein
MATICFFCFSGNRSRPTTQSGSSAIKESADSNSATIDDANDTERIDRISKNK